MIVVFLSQLIILFTNKLLLFYKLYISCGMKKNQIIADVVIEKLWYEGIGVSHFSDGKTLIIKWWPLPGMVCDVKVVKNYKDYAECHIVHIHSLGKEYNSSTIKCPHYLYATNDLPTCKTGCWWCKWQIASYDQQLLLKKQIIQDSFRFFNPSLVSILDPLASPDIRGYRNKIEYSFGKFISWRWDEKKIESNRSLWFHRQGMFGKIVDIDQCFLVDSDVNALFHYCKKLIHSFWVPVYDQMQHQWVRRHLMIRQAKNTNQKMLIISVWWEFDALPNRSDILTLLLNDVRLRSKVDTCILIINDSLADVVATRDSVYTLLRWSGIIDEYLVIWSHKLTFSLSPQSFFQTNTHGAELLYTTAITMSKLALWDRTHGTILDLYCWTGTIWLSFIASWIGDRLIGIEETPSAIQDAQNNVIRNNIWTDTLFIAWKVEQLLNISQDTISVWWDDFIPLWSLRLIIVDPPRSGLHKDVLTLLGEIKLSHPHVIICYISCNPVTLARDCKILTEHYTMGVIQPIDMFPHTHHIESIVILS